MACEDAWVVSSALMPLTERLKFFVALRPGVIAQSVAARTAANSFRSAAQAISIEVMMTGLLAMLAYVRRF